MTTPAVGNVVDLSGTHGDAACVELFTDTMERLNEIAMGQMQAILDLAIAAADAANSIDPANDQGAKFVEKVTQTLDEIKSKIDTPATASHDSGGTPAGDDAFCRTVENDIA